jgi:hypothetical protein
MLLPTYLCNQYFFIVLCCLPCESQILPMPEIIINLNESADAKDFKAGDGVRSGNLIHHDEYKNVRNWIEKRIVEMPVDASSIDVFKVTRQRQHDTITILGTRGSGKTSFLLSVLNSYKNDNNISVLKIIDPTLIEEKGHVFLSIISGIKSQVEQALDKKDASPGANSVNIRKQWRDKLKNLAHGLPSIDGVGHDLQQDAWQDPEFIMDKGIRQVTSASQLEENFEAFVTEGLDILNKKCFLIPFDDIDIDFRKGWAVLETIRKYLTSPKIVVLLSGDMKLFSLGIRKQQWLNFGKALLINEGEYNCKMSAFNDRVTDMESQYMQKVLKPVKRVPLTTLYEKLRVNGKRLQIIIQPGVEPHNTVAESEKYEIRNVYRSILGHLGIRNSSQSEVYSSFILNLPLRTQIQFLTEYFNTNDRHELRLTDSFLSYLYEKNVSVDLAQSSPRFLNQIILRLLLDEQYLEEGFQLQPTSSQASLDGSLMALSFLFSQHSSSNSFLVFDYLVKIGYVYNLFDSSEYPYELKENKIGNGVININGPTIQGLVKHAGIHQDWDLKNIASRIVSYSRGSLNYFNKKMVPEEGVIPLNTTAKSRKQKELLDRIDYIFKENDADRAIAYLPLTKLKYASKRGSVLAYSIFQLLSASGQLLRELEELEAANQPEFIFLRVQELLVSISQLKTYITPEFDKKNTRSQDSGYMADKVDEGSMVADENISKYIANWFLLFPGSAISPHLLGKISKRFFTSVGKIENESKGHSLGEVFHAQIIAFMNSVLIEDVREAGEGTLSINFSNTVFSNRYFRQNLIKSMPLKEKLSLSRWLLSNPLLIVFLDIKLPARMLPVSGNSYTDEMEHVDETHLQVIETDLEVKTEYLAEDLLKQKEKREKDRQDLHDALRAFLETDDFDQITKESLFEKMNKIPLHDDVYSSSTPGNTNRGESAGKSSGSRTRIDYDAIVSTLEDNKVPYRLFDPEVTDRKTVTNNNAEIRSKYSNILKDTSTIRLANIRNHVAKHPDRKWPS